MKPREDHVGLASAVVRAKPVHYGWLGLAPPSWSVGAGRRWQRRFFILFDLGTLSWALDDNAGTEPAGSIDLNKPFSVDKAERWAQIPNTICITSKDDGSKILVRSDTSEEFVFWFKSMQKMIADCEEKVKEDRRKKKMLANRRRHHTVSVTATNTALAEAKSLNRERRHQTMTNSSGGIRRERPTSLATTVPVQSSAPPTPTGSGLTPAICRLVSPQALPILENEKPSSPEKVSTSLPGTSARNEPDRVGRHERRIQSSRVAESYNRPYVSSTTSSYSQRSSSVDRRVNYSDRARTASSEVSGPLKASWLSLVNAAGFSEAASQISKRMWFTLLPTRLKAYAGPSSSNILFELDLRKASVKSYDTDKNKYYCFLVEAGDKSVTIGVLTDKIRRMWIEVVEDAIGAKGSRSSSNSSHSGGAVDQPPTDITNLPPKLASRGSTSSTTSQSSSSITITSNAFSDQNRVPPVFSEITPTAIVHPEPKVEPETISDPLAMRVTSRDSPPLRHRRRNRQHRNRSKTLDLHEISDIVRRSDLEKPEIDTPPPLSDVWKMIQDRTPDNGFIAKSDDLEKTKLAEMYKQAEEDRQKQLVENTLLRDQLEQTRPNEEFDNLCRQLASAHEELEELKTVRLSPPRGDREMSLQSQLKEIEQEFGQSQSRLDALLQRRSSTRDESSGDLEVFSTPPSSPQPISNFCQATQTQSSIDSSRLKLLESDISRLQLKQIESERSSKDAAKQRKADLSAEKTKRREAESERDDLRARLEAVEVERDEFKHRQAQSDDEVDQLRAELAGLKKLVSSDLQTALDSISTRGPYINLDSPLSDIESQILQKIKVQSRLHT